VFTHEKIKVKLIHRIYEIHYKAGETILRAAGFVKLKNQNLCAVAALLKKKEKRKLCLL
jgi:hypothetical protein